MTAPTEKAAPIPADVLALAERIVAHCQNTPPAKAVEIVSRILADQDSQEERIRQDERDRLYAEACEPMPDDESNETVAALACAAATWLRLTQGVQPADRARLRGDAS